MWRASLSVHHVVVLREMWPVNDRKGPHWCTHEYDHILDGAVCHGWVDGLVRGLDESRDLMRWTPRRRGGHWTAANRDRARGLAAAGTMTAAGLALSPRTCALSCRDRWEEQRSTSSQSTREPGRGVGVAVVDSFRPRGAGICLPLQKKRAAAAPPDRLTDLA
ncbi:MAG: hypothetical protein NVS3B18_15930 [Candidatus Dormibacteria bacterium]